MDVLVVMAYGREQVGHVMIVERVTDVPALPRRLDYAGRTKKPQLVARGARGELSSARQLLHGLATGQQSGDDAQPARRGEGPQGLRKFLEVAMRKRFSRGAMLGGMRHATRLATPEQTLRYRVGADVPCFGRGRSAPPYSSLLFSWRAPDCWSPVP
jgi:hypothetical protein